MHSLIMIYFLHWCLIVHDKMLVYIINVLTDFNVA